jgi:hypothetical protein
MPTPAELLSIYTTQSQISNFFISEIGQIWVSAYGAVGDGVTDDTLAVQAAVDAAIAAGVSDVNFVGGKTYYITSLSNTSGIIFLGNSVTITGGASITFSNPASHLADSVYFVTRQAGVDKTGTTDSTVGIQAAIDYVSGLGGGVVYFPAGTYKTNTALSVPSNVILKGAGKDITLIECTGAAGNTINLHGVYGAEIAIAANKTRGDTVIDTVSAHGLSVGDLVIIKGQRDALTSDAGDDWRLGYATPTTDGCYFAEFLLVKEVNSATRFTSASKLIFPDYKTDASAETATTARASTTVSKVTPVQNASVQSMTIRLNVAAEDATRLVSMQYCYNCFVDDVKFDMQGYKGAAVTLYESYMCEVRNSNAWYDPEATLNSFSYNSFRTAGAYKSGFVHCKVENGYQCFDFSYVSLGLPSVECYMIDCDSENSKANAGTSHSGTYQLQIVNNRFTHCQVNGFALRTRNSIFKGNVISGAMEATVGSYGLSIYEGWARNCDISDNIINGFYHGCYLVDGSVAEEIFEYVGLNFSGNIILNCYSGFFWDRNSYNNSVEMAGILISGNHFYNVTQYGVYLDDYTHGNVICDNTFHGAMVYGIYVKGENSYIEIYDNTYLNIGVSGYGVYIGALTDTVRITWGAMHKIGRNTFAGAIGVKYFINTVDFSTDDIISCGGQPAITQKMAGLGMYSAGMTAANKYTPAIKFGSYDSDLTTHKPKMCAGIAGRATETYDGDTKGGMAIDFFINPAAPGADVVPVVGASIEHQDNLACLKSPGMMLLKDGVTAPGTNLAGYAKIYIDTADGDLKIRFADGIVKVIVADT